jgi:hypothetical protein
MAPSRLPSSVDFACHISSKHLTVVRLQHSKYSMDGRKSVAFRLSINSKAIIFEGGRNTTSDVAVHITLALDDIPYQREKSSTKNGAVRFEASPEKVDKKCRNISPAQESIRTRQSQRKGLHVSKSQRLDLCRAMVTKHASLDLPRFNSCGRAQSETWKPGPFSLSSDLRRIRSAE